MSVIDLFDTFLRVMQEDTETERLREALEEIVRREARSQYASIYSAPGEFAAIARAALDRGRCV